MARPATTRTGPLTGPPRRAATNLRRRDQGAPPQKYAWPHNRRRRAGRRNRPAGWLVPLTSPVSPASERQTTRGGDSMRSKAGSQRETLMTQVPGAQVSRRELARCHEVIRAQFGGYERCHRNAGHEPLPHHVHGRSWAGSWSAGTARIRFGMGCDDECVFGDQVTLWRRSSPADRQQQRVSGPAKAAPCDAAGRPAETVTLACGCRWPDRSPT
jgi:hypothetical protein